MLSVKSRHLVANFEKTAFALYTAQGDPKAIAEKILHGVSPALVNASADFDTARILLNAHLEELETCKCNKSSR